MVSGAEKIKKDARRGLVKVPRKGGVVADKSGKKRFVLLIGDEGGILVYMQGMRVVRRLFAPSPQPTHTEAMVELVRTNPSVPVYVLADVIDQQYVRHTFPPVSQFSVGGLVKRRLNRDFQPEDLKSSMLIGRDKVGRKEWNYLLVGLAKTPLLSSWLDVLLELPNEFGGVYLSPVEAANYLAMIHRAKGTVNVQSWQMMVSHNKVSGFRQIVACDGKLVFTRVSQAIDDGVPAVIAGNIEQEVLNTLEYLRRLNLQENALIDMTVIVAQDVKDVLDMRRFGFSTSYVMSPLEVAETLQIEQAALSADRFGDVVMASAFGIAKKRILRFSTAYADALAKLYQLRRATRSGMFFLSAVLLALAGQSIVSAIHASADTARAEEAAHTVKAELVSLHKMVDGLDKNVAFKTAIVTTYGAYFKDTHLPDDFARELAPALGTQERIVAFEWKNNANGATTAAAAAAGAPPAPANSQGAGAAGAAGVGPLEIKIEFSFDGQYQDVEALTRSAKTFVAGLQQKMPAYDIINEPYMWLKDGDKNMEVSLDQSSVSNPIPQGKNRLVVIFHGPRKTDATKAPASAPSAPMVGTSR